MNWVEGRATGHRFSPVGSVYSTLRRTRVCHSFYSSPSSRIFISDDGPGGGEGIDSTQQELLHAWLLRSQLQVGRFFTQRDLPRNSSYKLLQVEGYNGLRSG